MTAVPACEMLYLMIGDPGVIVLVLNKIIFHLTGLACTYNFCKNETQALWSLNTFNLCSYRHRLKRTGR